MACNTPKILEKNNVKASNANLLKLNKVFENPKSSTLDKKFILNTVMRDAIKKRNSLLNAIYPKGIPSKFEVLVTAIPVTQENIDQKVRNSRNAANSILAADTLKVGRSESVLGDFVNSVKQKLNKIFQKSLTVIEYMESEAYTKFLKTASKADINVFQYLLFNSRKLEEFFYGKDRTNPIIDFMADTTAGRTAFKFAVTQDQDTRTDLLKYLVKRNENGQLEVDPLVLEAINLAIYNWQSTQARKTYFNGEAEINTILGRDSRAEISAQEWETFANIGVVRAAVIDSIGKDAYELLGFEAKKNVDGTFSPKLKIALGELAVSFMLENNMLDQTPVEGDVFPANNIFESDQNKDGKKPTLFIKVTDKDLVDQVSENRQNTNVPKDIFGLESTKIFPSFKPIDKVVEIMKRTTQKVSAVTRKLLGQMQKDKWEVKTVVSDKLFNISDSLRKSILGFIEDVEGEHITVQKKIEAQNNKIEQTLEDFQEFTSKLKKPDSPFYFKYFISRVGRMFIDNNTINPLQDKIIRYLVGLKKYNVTVNSTSLRIKYKLAIAQAFGFDIDKNNLDTSIKVFKTILKDNAAAIDALRSDTLTSEQEAIVKAAIDGKEGIATFEALLSLRDFSETEAFDTNIAIETDAVTSGVAIGMMQSLLDGYEDLPSIGVNIDGSNTTYAKWRSKLGNLDLYQKLTSTWSKTISEIVKLTPGLKNSAVAMREIIEQFVGTNNVIQEIGRKYSKDPLMIANYGSQINKIRVAFQQTVLAKFYKEITKANNPQIYYDYAVTILGEELDIDPETKPQNFVFTSKQERAFLDAVDTLYGTALESSLNERLANFLNFRDNINNAFHIMFYVFEAKFISALDKATKKKGKPLSIEEQEVILESIRKYFPVVKGALSQGLEDGILIIKGGLARRYELDSKAQQQYSRPINNTGDTSSMTSHAKSYKFANPGAAGTVSQIHNLDSAIEQAMLTTVEAMGAHDAGFYSLEDVETGTRKYNEAFLEINTSFNIMLETWKSYKRIVALGAQDTEIRAAINAALKKNVFKNKKQTIREQQVLFEQEFLILLNEVTAAREAFLKDNPQVSVNQASLALKESVFVSGSNKSTLEKEVDGLVDSVFETVTNIPPKEADKKRKETKKKAKQDEQTKEDIAEAQRRRQGTKQAKENREINETDSLFTFLRKKGGIDVTTDTGLGNILKPLNILNKIIGVPVIAQFKEGHTGLDISTAAQLATDAGYIELNKQGNVDEGALTDILSETDSGQSHFNAIGNEAILQEELDNEFLDQQDIDEAARVKEFQERERTEQKPIEGDQDNLFGSSSRTIDFDAFVSIFSGTIDSTSLIPLFEHLATIGSKQDSQEHTDRLTEVLTNLIHLQGSIDLKVGETDTESFGAQRTFKDGQQDIHIMGSASTIRNNAQLSAQEIYVHELVHAITEAGIDSNPSMRKSLKRLYTQSKAHFSYTDFLPDTAGPHTKEEIATAKETYAYIFNNNKGATGVRSTKSANPYLHEFVAYGLTNAAFIKKLSTIPAKAAKKKAPSNVWEQLVQWYQAALEFLTDRIHGIDSLSTDKAIRKLTDKMLATQDQNKGYLYKAFQVLSGTNQYAVNALMNYILKPIVSFRKSYKPTHIPGRIIHNMAAILDIEVLIGLGKVVKQVSRNIGITEKSFITKLVREIQGLTEGNEIWHSLLRLSKKTVDQARVHIAVNVAEQIRADFKTAVSKEESTALYTTFLKTDLVSLLNTYEKGKYTPDNIIKLLNDPATLSIVIGKLEKQIRNAGFGKNNSKYYLSQAQGLGNLMTLGKDFVAGQMKNAFIIANLSNTEAEQKGDINKAEMLIDELATLYAISNIDISLRNSAADVYTRENAADGQANGIVTMLYLHNLNKEESLEQLFSGNKMQTEKGYTKETFNPNIDIKISPKVKTEVDPVTGEVTRINMEEILNKEGYIRISDEPLPKDPLDTSSGARYLFVSRNSPSSTWVKSIVSLTAEKAGGTTIDDIYSAIGGDTSYIDAQLAIQEITKQVEKDIKNQFKGKDTESSLLPLVDDKGKTVNYRYVMAEHVKTTVMERDNRFDYAVGRMFGSIRDKTASKVINKQVLTIAKEEADKNFLSKPSDYVDIGPTSTDPELAEIYSLLPTQMKEDMVAIWGEGNPILIKAEFVNLIFGFRKLRLKDMNNQVGSAIRGVNQSITWLMQATFFPEAPNADIGKLWAEVVNLAKEMIVVKTGVILLPNFISNNYILLTKGVFPGDIATSQTEALLELDQYHKDVLARDILDRELRGNKELTDKQRKTKESELARLNTDIFTNPVHPLLEEGIFQSIIEDIDFEEDIFTSRAKLGNKVEELANEYLPEFTMTAAKHMYFTKDTKPYKVLLKATQVSDFVARYALWKHRMDNTPDTINTDEEREAYRKDVVNEVVETFVNYDVPTSKEMQWINDMGFLMFTKFYFRIQKIIFGLFKDRPASVVAGLVAQRMMGDVEDIGDSSFFEMGMLDRGNPPLDIIDTANDIALWEWLT